MVEHSPQILVSEREKTPSPPPPPPFYNITLTAVPFVSIDVLFTQRHFSSTFCRTVHVGYGDFQALCSLSSICCMAIFSSAIENVNVKCYWSPITRLPYHNWWWWLFPRMRRFWDNVRPFISRLRFFFFFFLRWRLAHAHYLHSLCQDQSTVAQRT